jgi:hypothetical protein
VLRLQFWCVVVRRGPARHPDGPDRRNPDQGDVARRLSDRLSHYAHDTGVRASVDDGGTVVLQDGDDVVAEQVLESLKLLRLHSACPADADEHRPAGRRPEPSQRRRRRGGTVDLLD